MGGFLSGTAGGVSNNRTLQGLVLYETPSMLMDTPVSNSRMAAGVTAPST
jgi:hypothetical protein